MSEMDRLQKMAMERQMLQQSMGNHAAVQPDAGAGEAEAGGTFALTQGPMAPRMRRMTEERLAQAQKTMIEYKNGKNDMDERLIANERWWDARAWHLYHDQGNKLTAKRPTMWLFNVVLGKHADFLESFPEPVVQPREQGDEMTAKILTSVLPVVLEENDFKKTYNKQAWEKNKSGTAIYAITWDKNKHHGLGDVAITAVDPLSIYWEPGIEDIQKSKNIFVTQWVDKDAIKSMYPQLEGEALENGFSQADYDTEGNKYKKKSDYALVVDWYYHTWSMGKKTLQYCKFVGSNVLYATEDMGEEGLYDDGEYPFVVDPLFPIKGSPAGRGYIDIGKNAQETIDCLDHAMVLNAMAGAIPRYMTTDDSPINEKEFMDFTKPVVHVTGSISETSWRQIEPTQLNAIHVTMLQNKIEELKQTTGNQDVSNGQSGGVTAAAAVAALQSAAGRSSRDAITGTWSAYSDILQMVISRMRQFYTTDRTFRILGERAALEYARIGKNALGMQPIENPMNPGEYMGVRIPEFDIQVHAQKESAYSRLANNELALQLLNAGVFNPQMADQSMMLLDMMDFPKKDDIMQKLAKYSQMMQQMAMWQQMALQLASKYEPETAEMMAANITGTEMPMGIAGKVDPELNTGTEESKVTQKARERAEQARQPA